MQVYEVLTTKDLKELTKHGTSSFPLAIYKTLLSKNRLGYVQLHWHEEIQFVLVTKGNVKFTVENISYIIKENNGIFINSNYLHSAKSSDCDDSEYICIDVYPNFFLSNSENIILEKYLDPFINSTSLSVITFSRDTDWENEALDLFEQLYNIYENKDFGYELKMQYLVLNVIYLIITNNTILKDQLTCFSYTEDQRIKEILSYIQDNYTHKITLEDMARNVSLSRAEFCRFFKKITKQTPFEYLISYRINQSTYLLRNTDLTITEIASKVGFGSVSYYTEKFRKQMNCTPNQFKNYQIELV